VEGKLRDAERRLGDLSAQMAMVARLEQDLLLARVETDNLQRQLVLAISESEKQGRELRDERDRRQQAELSLGAAKTEKVRLQADLDGELRQISNCRSIIEGLEIQVKSLQAEVGAREEDLKSARAALGAIKRGPVMSARDMPTSAKVHRESPPGLNGVLDP
jgi:chromosome segregation ATPase